MNKILILLIALIFTSCNKDQFVFLLESPSDVELNDNSVTIYVDDNQIYYGKLKSTNVTSIYNEIFHPISNGVYKLKVVIKNESFEYEIEYPKDKFIILSPSYRGGKIYNSILKKNEKPFLD